MHRAAGGSYCNIEAYVPGVQRKLNDSPLKFLEGFLEEEEAGWVPVEEEHPSECKKGEEAQF